MFETLILTFTLNHAQVEARDSSVFSALGAVLHLIRHGVYYGQPRGGYPLRFRIGFMVWFRRLHIGSIYAFIGIM